MNKNLKVGIVGAGIQGVYNALSLQIIHHMQVKLDLKFGAYFWQYASS